MKLAMNNAKISFHFFVYKHTNDEIEWNEDRDVDWSKAVQQEHNECPAEICSAEDPLFILYTSGSTGKPKGLYMFMEAATTVTFTHK